MPTVLKLKKAQEALHPIAEAEWEECKVEEARLQAEEEARVATEQARREEEEREREWVHLAEEARVWAEEEARACKEEERLAVECSLQEAEGSSQRKAPR